MFCPDGNHTLMNTHVLPHPGKADVRHEHGCSSLLPGVRLYILCVFIFLHQQFLSESKKYTHHVVLSGPKTLTSSTFLLSVSPSLNSGSLYVNHPSLTQSVHWISFSAVLHRACDWFTGTFSLKLEWHTILVCEHTHTHSLTYRLLMRWCAGPPLPRGE